MSDLSIDVLKITRLRVSVNKKYKKIYQGLTQNSNLRKSIFERHAKVFTFCAALGFKNDQRRALNSGEIENLFLSETLEEHDLTVIYSIAINTNPENNYNIISDKNEMLSIAEEYANAGMEILIDEVLSDYVQENEDDVLYLNYNDSSFLEKEILSFINSITNKSPFEE